MTRLLFFAPRLVRPGEISGAARSLAALRFDLAEAGHASVLLTDAHGTGGPADSAHRDAATVASHAPAAELAKVARAHGIEAVVIWSGAEIGPAIATCRAAGLPIVMFFRNCEFGSYEHLFDDAPDMLYLVVSRFAAERLRAWAGVHADVVAPIIEPAEPLPGPHDRVLFINPIPVKGCEIAFALARHLDRVPFLMLESWQVGEGWRAHCMARHARNGNIDWRSATDDMAPIWACARLLLMPSVWEEAGARSASEAQARGIPVVASARGGLPEIVGPGGVVLDLHAPIADWAAAVERLMRDDAWHGALSAAARAHAARAEYQPQQIVNRFVALVADHVARRRAAA